MFNDAYSGKRILVTGHTGFKGSWLSAWLLRLNAEVAGFSLDVPTNPSHYESIRLGGRVRNYWGDIRDAENLSRAFDDFRPDAVFHLAAQPLVRKSYQAPVETFETNMIGTLNVLEALRNRREVGAAVIITSDKCYRNDEWVWGYRENDRLGGADPYSASKACAELIAHSYFKSYFAEGPACATARAGNVIGGGDWAADRIVPDCARAWAAGRPVELRNPGATRPWQHVLEPLSGYLWLGARLLEGCGHARGESYNFGPPADVDNTVREVALELQKYWPGFDAKLDVRETSGARECNLLKLCCDKALADLRWKATLGFRETAAMTALWYAKFYETPGKDMWETTQEQIGEYARRASERGLLWAPDRPLEDSACLK